MTRDAEPVEIRVRDDGPYKVTGPVRILDPEGNELLPDDPDRCLEDFMERAHDHALRMAELLSKQEASVQRFLELNGEDTPEAL